MSDPAEQILLSEELLALMRNAAAIAQRLKEPFITTRTLILSLLDEPQVGAALAEVVPREKVEALLAPEDAKPGALQLPEPKMALGERAAMQRHNTLAFKLPDGSGSMWLSHDALTAFVEGSRRAEGRYLPKHLAFGIAAEAVRTPGVFTALHISPGTVTDAIYKLP